jgi:uncharacterized membrane protein
MTLVVFALLGGAIGLAISGGELSGFLAGAFAGVLASWVSGLSTRIQRLEQQIAALARVPKTAPGTAQAGAAAAPPPAAATAPRSDASAAATSRTGAAAPAEHVERPSTPDAHTAAPGASAAQASEPAQPTAQHPATQAAARARAVRRANLEPSILEQGFAFLKRWFTTGNVPVKVGVVLSVFGVGFLVKEGIDREWLAVPLELRLAFVALFGIGLLVLGWRLRNKKRTYALSVQGGGIAVLYLTIYASFALFELLPAGAAFALLLVVTAAAGTLAVLQDSRALAVLGIVGGFMAPVLVSSGTGNHVALFSYYAILNVAIVGIAWFKAWRELNVLGFLFTFGIGTLWGYNAYTPEQFASTEPFLILFVLMYIAIPVLFASREAPALRGFVDGTLTFGTPIVGFALQHQLVGDTEYGLAISALALAAVYVSVATFLLRRGAAELRVMVEAQFALAVAFLTVAIPLALDARWTSAAWALQGAAMVWLGFRQQRRLALAAGIVLQLASGVAYWNQPSLQLDDWPVLNGRFLGAFLLALAGWFSGRLFEVTDAASGRAASAGRRDRSGTLAFPLVSAAFLVWASAWWLFGGVVEIGRFVPDSFELAAELVFFGATALLAMVGAARAEWPRLNALGLVLWPAALFGAVFATLEVAHPAKNLGWLAWPAALAAMLAFLRAREERYDVLRPLLHATTYWLAGVLLVWETHWQVDRVADGIWPAAAALAMGTALVLGTLRLRERVAWPLAAHAEIYVKLCCGGALAALMLATIFGNAVSPGDSAPLPYVPLLNPLEVVSVFVCIVLLHWLAILERSVPALGLEVRHRAIVAGLFGWYLLTMTVARAVHHWAAVPFELDRLAESTVLQTSLSIVWGATALTAMVIGAHKKRRVVWITGAALMGVVVVKLFLVELGSSGTLTRIVSFLGVGLLLLVVGYFAPVPPRAELDQRAA